MVPEWLRGATPHPRSVVVAGRRYPRPRSGAARRSHPMAEARGDGLEEQPHVQGEVATPAQEGLEE